VKITRIFTLNVNLSMNNLGYSFPSIVLRDIHSVLTDSSIRNLGMLDGLLLFVTNVSLVWPWIGVNWRQTNWFGKKISRQRNVSSTKDNNRECKACKCKCTRMLTSRFLAFACALLWVCLWLGSASAGPIANGRPEPPRARRRRTQATSITVKTGDLFWSLYTTRQ
jgi:hypothetical protein